MREEDSTATEGLRQHGNSHLSQGPTLSIRWVLRADPRWVLARDARDADRKDTTTDRCESSARGFRCLNLVGSVEHWEIAISWSSCSVRAVCPRCTGLLTPISVGRERGS